MAERARVLLCALAAGSRDAVAGVLLSSDVAISSARATAEAVAMMRAERPAVIVVGSGVDQALTCIQLRAAQVGFELAIIAAVKQPSDVPALVAAGADDFFVEGLDDGTLSARLLVALRRAQARSARYALGQSAESLATTLDSIGDGVIALDVNGGVTLMNPVAERLTGWTLADAKGRSLKDVLVLVDGTTQASVENPFDRAMRSEAVVSLPPNSVLVRRDRSTIPIADTCAPIRGHDGTIQGAVIVFHDLTAQLHAAAVQEDLHRQLVFADRMASIGTLAAGVAHEINNPLSYAVTNVDLAIERLGNGAPADTQDLIQMLSEAREGMARVTKIVRGLKTFSRIEQERRTVISLMPVLELSVNMTLNEMRHRATLQKEYGDVPLVNADEARLSQVFINLLVNAAHAFAEGDASANQIRIVTSTDDAGWAIIEVSDTGIGIASDLVGRVFDPFFTTKRIGVGTGLGLAISHGIVTSMGGKITVDSKVGQGTTFRVALPPAQSAVSVPSTPMPSRPPDPHVATVLVVDDEASVGLVIRRVLHAHDVTVVTSAQAALDVLATGKKFDVVLSDLMMPGMSGIELYRSIVRVYPKMASHVVFVTGGAFTQEASTFLDEVTNERVAKPFDAAQLRSLIDKLIDPATAPS